MKKNGTLFLIIAGVAFFCHYNANAQNFWEQTGTLDKGISVFKITSKGDLIAANSIGLFKSTDGGKDWRFLDSLNYKSGWQDFTIDNQDRFYIILTGTDKIFRSTNEGASWEEIDDGEIYDDAFGISVFYIDNHEYLYAGTSTLGALWVYCSKDDGKSWQMITQSIGYGGSVFDILVNDSGYIFLSAEGFFRSVRGDTVWETIQMPASGYFGGLCKDSKDRIYAQNGSDIFRSSDNGVTWIKVDNIIQSSQINAIVYNSSGNNYALESNGSILRQSYSDSIWTPLNSGLAQPPKLECIAIDSQGYVYASTQNGVVYRSVSSTIKTNVKQKNIVESSSLSNYPNPFSAATTISYSLPEREPVDLAIYNSLGERIALLAHGVESAGAHSVPFQSDDLQNGIYFYRLTAGRISQTGKMAVIR